MLSIINLHYSKYFLLKSSKWWSGTVSDASVILFLFFFFFLLTNKLRIFQYVFIINYFRSGDSTARIWKIVDGACDSSVQNEPVNVVNVVVLQHFKESTNEKSKEPIY